jgi:hypothetical protein
MEGEKLRGEIKLEKSALDYSNDRILLMKIK